MYKFLSYLNGLKDGILILIVTVPISIIIGAIGMVVVIIRNESMRNYVNELASECDDRKSIKYSDYAKSEKKHKTKMGFSMD